MNVLNVFIQDARGRPSTEPSAIGTHMRIAVIGAGVSGLTAAYRLQERHCVTVFEAEDRLGGHALTIEVDDAAGRHPLDVGFMVFNDRTYPNFVRLLNELNIASRPTSMSFSVSDPRSGLEYNGHSPDTLFAQRRNLLNPRFMRMLIDILRFNRDAKRTQHANDSAETVADYLQRGRYSSGFIDHYLLPMGAAIWSCPTGAFSRFPMRFVARFFANHGLLDLVDRPLWRVIDGGSQTYVRALARRFQGDVRLSTPIEAVLRDRWAVTVRPRGTSAERFDHVVFACHSDQALRMLGSEATPTERELLTAFPYQSNTAVLHTDESFLPRTRRAWACWNFRTSADEAAPAVTTYHLNQLHGVRSSTNYCVTLNADEQIDPRRILRTMRFDHPVFTTRRDAAQERHGELIGPNRTSYCGAYWRNGFHEDGVVSALAVVESLNAAPSHSEVAAAAELQTEAAS